MIQFWKGTLAEYNTIKTNDKLNDEWVYFCYDDTTTSAVTEGSVYVGSKHIADLSTTALANLETKINQNATTTSNALTTVNNALTTINDAITALQTKDTELTNAVNSKQDALTFNGTYNKSSNPAATVSTVTNAINALDGSVTGTGSFIKTLSQTNGVVTATKGDILASDIPDISATYATQANLTAEATRAAAAEKAASDAAAAAKNRADAAYTLADAAQTAAEVEAAITAKGYLTTSSASSTYLTKTDASSTYATKTALSATETKASAAKTAIDAFLKDADATENAVDTLKEIQAQLDSGEASAASLLSEINNIKGGTTTVGKAAALEVTAAVGDNTQPVYIDAYGKPQTIGYTIAKSVPSDAQFSDTDTKVTSAANHYAPTADAASVLSPDASSTTAATWGSTSLVTGVNISRDAKGHVVGLTLDSIQMPANPNTDTHYSSKNIVGASATASANAAVNSTNANGVFLNHLESNSNTPTSSHQIIGAGNVKVTSDANGKITITGTDKDTHYTAVPHIGTNTSTSNQTTTNTNTYINIVENSARSGGVKVTGSNGISVSGASGTLTIDASTLAGALTWKTGTSF